LSLATDGLRLGSMPN